MIDFAPMLASSADAPFDSEEYVFEVKWDGIRCLCATDGETTQLYSRTGRDITRLFPELQPMPDTIAAHSVVLDGELCVFDGAIPSFHHIQRRNVLRGDAAIRSAARNQPALYVVFDLLHVNGVDVVDLPFAYRRRQLEDVWLGFDHATLSVVVPERGRDLYDASIAQGLEGIVAKRVDSPYVPGRRTAHWLKIRHQRELDAVISGYTPRGHDDFASLAVGLYAPTPAGRTLIYIGNVGTGFPAGVRRDTMARMHPLKIDLSPFANSPATNHAGNMPAPLPTRSQHVHTKHARLPPDTQWVHPQLVCRVGYLQFTPGGHLRHPTFLGLRDDKHPYECTFTTSRHEAINARRTHPDAQQDYGWQQDLGAKLDSGAEPDLSAKPDRGLSEED